MIYRGKISRIISPSLVDVKLTLGFGVALQRKVYLKDPPTITDMGLQQKAIHCLVVLMGGKAVFIDVPGDSGDGRVHGVFYRELDDDRVDCFSDFLVSEHLFVPANVVNVNKYLRWLSGKNFEVSDVKERIIHGRVR